MLVSLSVWSVFNSLLWIPETLDNTEPYIYYCTAHIHISTMIKFSLLIRLSKKSTTQARHGDIQL